MDEMTQLKQCLLYVTVELVSPCKFCSTISDNPDHKTPVHCLKYSGSTHPICVNVATCIACGEYKKFRSSEDFGLCAAE